MKRRKKRGGGRLKGGNGKGPEKPSDDRQLHLFTDPEMARAGRDEGMRAALEHAGDSWQADGTRRAESLRAWRGTGEDLRLKFVAEGMPLPPHPNAWGGFCGGLVKKGILLKTGGHSHMKTPKSHARSTPVYWSRQQ